MLSAHDEEFIPVPLNVIPALCMNAQMTDVASDASATIAFAFGGCSTRLTSMDADTRKHPKRMTILLRCHADLRRNSSICKTPHFPKKARNRSGPLLHCITSPVT